MTTAPATNGPGRAPRRDATKADSRRRADHLREQIRRHDYRYYILDRPTISDAAYDSLMRELAAIETRFPDLVSADSPTQRVAGGLRAGFRTVAHHAPMLSLASTTDDADVRQFDARVRALAGTATRYVLEPKFDGLSIEVVYEHGVLVSASTRGTGRRGEDITANVRAIASVPLQLHGSIVPVPALVAVRGEALMRRRDFAELNQRLARAGKPLFANPRNAAAGSIRQLDPAVTAERHLDVCFYDVLALEGGPTATTASDYNAWLRAWGLRTSPHRRAGVNAGDILAYRTRLAHARAALDVEIDGVVAKVDSLAARTRLGATANHPRWAIAAKFEARTATTRIERIDAQVGRTGVLTPVAVLRPVELGGVTVSRATLHNWDELARRGLRAGDTVEVARAGDVIPEIVARVRPAKPARPAPRPPTRCPSCGAPLERRGPLRACANGLACPAQRVRAIQHFASRAAFDIAGLGPSTVTALVDAGLVRTAADLFSLTDDDLRGLPRFGPSAATRLASAIAASRHVPLDRFLFALGIPSVGRSAASALARALHTLAAIRHASPSELAAVKGVGRAAAQQIAGFFTRPANQRAVDALLRHGVVVAGRRRSGARSHD